MDMKSYRMQDMTFPEVKEYLKTNKTVIIPYALSEQHGAHLPLDVDIRNCNFVSAKLAEKLGCITAPTLNYTFSGGMLPGTINVKPNTFSNLVGEIIESLALQGFENFIIVPGHGGSESLLHLKESLRILKWLNPALKDTLILLTQIWDFSPSWTQLFAEHDYHAAWAETSLLLHWCPEVVRMDKLEMDVPEVAERLREDPDSYQLRESFTEMKQEVVQTTQREDVKIGVMGFPEKANAAFGAKIEKEFLDNAVPAIKQAIAAAEDARKTGKRIVQPDNVKMKINAI
ncbi:MAG: creatininase family protein [Lentisphaerae bacterium]|nr:creatininase family protein [Lentisphaerota bacterium]